MRAEICHPIDVAIIGNSPEPRLTSGNAELRPSLLHQYASNTRRCYRQRLAHYQHWCRENQLQPGVEFIDRDNDGNKLLAYVQAQIDRWSTEDLEAPEDPAYRRLRPDTIRQTINALVYYAERAGVGCPDDRKAKVLLGQFAIRWKTTQAPAYRVPGRRSPRSPRFTAPVQTELLFGITD
jgi:hypothetical protein